MTVLPGVAGISPCPSEDLFAALVEGGLSPVERPDVERRLDACPECRAVLGAFVAAAEPADATPWAKTVGGLTRSPVRGIRKTQLFAHMVAAAYNLLRMARLLALPP